LNGFASRIRPFRIVLRWQLVATAVLTLVAAIHWGGDGALSAALGGAVNIVAGGVYGWRVARGEARTAGEAVATMFRAWGIKVLLIVAQLMLVLSLYGHIVHAAFFAAFVVTVAVFAAAVAVGEPKGKQDPPLIEK
jgi:F0F1-type ATP synthase assembly protein I